MSEPADSEALEPQEPERRREHPADGGVPVSAVRIPGILVAVLIALGVSIIGLILIGLVDPSVTSSDVDEQSDGGVLGVQAFGVLGFVIAAVAVTMYANRGSLGDALGRLGLAGGSRIPSTFFLAIVIYLVAALAISYLLQPEQQDIAETLGADQDASVIVLVAAGLLIIAGAAIGEELFFRGLLFGGLRQTLPFAWAALISGVLFGLPHLPQGDLAVAAQLSVFGIVLAWAYERSGTLWVTIALHALNNTAAFILLVTDSV